MTTPDTTRAVELARNTPDQFRDDAERSLFIAADRLYWASRADASGMAAGTRGAAERHDAAREAFAKMLRDPANVGHVADVVRDVIRQRRLVAILRGSIAGDPKDIAAGMPDGLTPVGTLEALLSFAREAFKVTKAIDADPTATEDMLNDAGDHLVALRGALELTKD